MTAKYSGLVGDVTDQVSIMDETGHKMKIQNKNIKKLIQDISLVLDTLEYSNTYRLALMDGNLMDPTKLPEIMEAANNLTKTLKATLPAGFDYHPAVIKQKRTLENLKKTFGNRATGHLGKLCALIAAVNHLHTLVPAVFTVDCTQLYDRMGTSCHLSTVHRLASTCIQ